MSKKRNYLRKAGSVWTAVFLLACSVCVHTSANAVETESAAEDGAWTDEAAVTINGTDYDLAHFNYYFQSWYDSFSGENAAMLPYMFDQSRSLKEQEYEDGRTWFDYFIDEASVSMQQIVTLAEEAKKADYKLDKEAEEEIGRVLEAVSGFAGTLGMDADSYLEYFYGEGMDTEEFTGCLADARLAEGYSGQVRDSFRPEDERIREYYEDHIRDFTTVKYERFFARACAMGEEPAPEEMDEAKALAEEVLEKVQSGVSLKEASQGLEDKGTYHSFNSADYIDGSVYGDWLFDASRSDGDCFLTEEANGWYVMVFHSRDEADYPAVSILDAFFPVDETKGTVDEQLEASCLEAEAFEKEWEEKGADLDAFRLLARSVAEKSGTAAEYAALTKEMFSGSVNKWLFDPQRKSGDVSVLYASDGFHVMYYAGEAQPAWKVMAEEALKAEAYSEWFDALMESSVLVRHDDVLEHAGGY